MPRNPQGRHLPHRLKPQPQGCSGVLEDRASRNRALVSATGTFPQDAAAWPRFVAATPGTTKTIRPAQLEKILATPLLTGEPGVELPQVPRIIFHPRNTTHCGYRSQAHTQFTENRRLGYQMAFRQFEVSDTCVFDRPQRGPDVVGRSHPGSSSMWAGRIRSR